jgi:hypothetical protein
MKIVCVVSNQALTLHAHIAVRFQQIACICVGRGQLLQQMQHCICLLTTGMTGIIDIILVVRESESVSMYALRLFELCLEALTVGHSASPSASGGVSLEQRWEPLGLTHAVAGGACKGRLGVVERGDVSGEGAA